MKKHTITEKEYIEIVESINTLTSENKKLRCLIDEMRDNLASYSVNKQLDSSVAVRSFYCNNEHNFIERCNNICDTCKDLQD